MKYIPKRNQMSIFKKILDEKINNLEEHQFLQNERVNKAYFGVSLKSKKNQFLNNKILIKAYLNIYLHLGQDDYEIKNINGQLCVNTKKDITITGMKKIPVKFHECQSISFIDNEFETLEG